MSSHQDQTAPPLPVDDLSGDILIVDESSVFADQLQKNTAGRLRVWFLDPTDMPRAAVLDHTLCLPPEFPPISSLRALYLASPVALARQLIIGRDSSAGDVDLRQQVLHLFAVCRDRVGGRVVVLLDQECSRLNIARDDLFSLGFHRFNNTLHERLFMFSLSGYKTVPQWLNSRYWANPERFHLVDGSD